jgi:hypothetical protein
MKFPALLQKMLALSIVFTIFGSLVAPLTYAQEYAPIPPARAPFYEPVTNPDVPKNTHTQTQVLFIEVANTLLCQFIGIDMIDHGKPCLSVDVASGKIGYAKQAETGKIGGLLGGVSHLIGSTYNMPIHSNDYVQYMAQNFGFPKKTYAQGTGFTELKPLLDLWTRMRDLCYLAFVIIFVLLGFGIMLRIKIDPRTVMSIQNQIPKVIIAILLITFSYAIAGFLVDVMWTVTYLGINVLTATPSCNGGTVITGIATNSLMLTPISYVSQLLSNSGCGGIGWGIWELSYNLGQSIGDLIVSIITNLFTGGQQGGVSCSWTSIWTKEGQIQCVGELLFGVFSFIFGLIAMLIIVIAIFVQLLRVWFSLIKAYFYVIIYTITGPFYILLGLLPGQQSFGFEKWLRYMASALSMFPTAAFIFIGAAIIANNSALNGATVDPSTTFVPPLIGNPNVQSQIGMLIALGAILISPEIVNMMRNAFKAPASKYAPEVYKGIGRGASKAQQLAGGPSSYMMRQGDPSKGDSGGYLFQKLAGTPAYKTNEFGHNVVDYSKTPNRFKAVSWMLKGGK